MQPKLFTLLLLSLFLGGSLTASAQATKKSGPATTDCTGAYTGVVMYTRVMSTSETKTTERVSNRGKDTRRMEMKYDYKGMVTVTEDRKDPGSMITKATINHTFTSTDSTTAVEKNSCDRGKTWQDMKGTFVSQTKVTGQGKEDANVHIGLNDDGTYSVSVGIPEIDGTVTGSETSSFSGQCKPKEGKNLTMPPTKTKIQGNSLSSDGKHRVDPRNPNQLSGSYTLSLPGGGSETITWNLEKCGRPLRLVGLKFEDMKYPTWDAWQEINETTGTVDGNWVMIKAIVFNDSGETKTAEVYLKETYKGDKWDGARPDVPLKDQTFTVTLEPGEAQEVAMLWDTDGYAWFDDGRPRLVQRIKAEVWEKAKKADEMTKNLKVLPRPLVVVPGLLTKTNQIDFLRNLLTTAHSYGWKACGTVDTSSDGKIQNETAVAPTTSNRSVYDHAENLTRYANSIRSTLNAWHVDMLGDSTGGLVARLYVHKEMDVLPDGYPVVKHLMLTGTPNKGVDCIDPFVMKDAFRNDPRTAQELKQEEIALFNQYVTQRKGTKFSALAGNSIPILCAMPQWNDSFVSVESAKYGIEDVTLTSSKHGEMLTAENFTNYVKPHIVVGPRGTYPLAAAPSK